MNVSERITEEMGRLRAQNTELTLLSVLLLRRLGGEVSFKLSHVEAEFRALGPGSPFFRVEDAKYDSLRIKLIEDEREREPEER